MGVHGLLGHSHDCHTTSGGSLPKRRRVSPEAMEEDDLDSIPHSDSARDSKRRRTAAPSLDGMSRGWEPPSPPATQSSSSSFKYSTERGDEDNESDWDTENDESHSSRSEDWKHDVSEYGYANTLLHTLHAQSRLRVQPIFYHYHQPGQLPSPSPSVAENEFVSQGRTNTDIVESPDVECQLVKERYEERNKLLGSLFLSRRRDLHDSNSIPL